MKFQRASEVLEKVFENIREKKRVIPFPKELPGLTRHLKGIFQSELWIIGGYTSSGKTFLALQMALAAAQAGFKTAYISLEMSVESLVMRIWASLAGISPMNLQFGNLTLQEIEKSKSAKTKIDQLPLYLTDSLYGIYEIEKAIREFLPDLVLIDFIQNLLSERTESEYEKISNGIIALQKLAKELNNSVIVCSQISNFEAKQGVDSSIIGLKGSGTLSSAADLVLWLEKPKGKQEFSDECNKRSLYIRKNRRGSNFYLDVVLDFPNGIFREVE
jgi:replicative DNA helicase